MPRIYTIGGHRMIARNCITCGVFYALPETMWNHHVQAGGFHTCLNGHEQGWDKEGSENGRLRRDKARLQQRIAQRDDEIRDLERSVSAQKGNVTKLKRRAGSGTCPCCQRSFMNVNAHLAKKHPEFVVGQRLCRKKLALVK